MLSSGGSTGGGRLFTRIDHVTIGVADLKAGIARTAISASTSTTSASPGTTATTCTLSPRLAKASRLSPRERRSSRGFGRGARAPRHRLPHAGRADRTTASRHPNGVQRIERVYIAVKDLAAAASPLRRVLGVPAPKMERGTVINADNGDLPARRDGAGLGATQRAGRLRRRTRRGPGPFQILVWTSSMDAARMDGRHGLPPPARGIRNTGEQAMLVMPEHACGVYIGFVGPA